MNTRRDSAFSLIEVMVATAMLVLLTALLLGATEHSGRVLQQTSGRIEQFREARQAHESITRRVAEATLNTYWDYTYRTEGTAKIPTAYTRQSELRFRSGLMESLAPESALHRPTHGVFFQAPAGEVEVTEHRALDQALNTWGFFVEIGSDEEWMPNFLKGHVPPRVRSRLFELREPTESLSIYQPIAGKPYWWFAEAIRPAPARPARVLAENVMALVILPRLARADEVERGTKPPLSPNYEYDSTLNSVDADINPKNQLPPVLQVVMVAVDEPSAQRLAEKYAGTRDLGVKTDDLFKKSQLLEDDPATSEAGDGDLHTLEKRLITEHANYRVFSTNVAIRGAKWSRAQTN